MYALSSIWSVIEDIQSSEDGKVQPEMVHPILRAALRRADANVYERAKNLLENTDDSGGFESPNSNRISLELDIQAAVLENNPEKVVQILDTMKAEKVLPR